MSSTGDILRKKMRPRPTEVGPGLAWWQLNADRVLRDVCKATMALDVSLSELEGRNVAATSGLTELGKVMLPFLLQTRGGQAGLFVIDGALIDGLIEIQMLGKVLPTARLDRPITAIDAGLSEGFVRATLAGLTDASGHLGGLTTKGPQQDRATLRLELGEGNYDILSAQISLGPDIKIGNFEIWLPSDPPRRATAAQAQPNPALAKVLEDCPVDLHTQMQGCEASAKDLLELKVGSVLTMPATALTDVALMDCNKNVVAKGRLGQLNGRRAIRITQMKMVCEPIAGTGAPPTADAPALASPAPAAPAPQTPKEPAPKAADAAPQKALAPS